MSERQAARVAPVQGRIEGSGKGASTPVVRHAPEVARPPARFDFSRVPVEGESAGGGRQRQTPQIAGVRFSTGTHEVHVPLMGITQVTASTSPANLANITWSLAAGTAQVGAATAISATGVITFDPAQAPGTLTVRADQALPGGATAFATQDLVLTSHPSGISSTTDTGGSVGASKYGSVFDHDFSAASGTSANIENVPVGEKFPGLPNPNGTSHTLQTPFGQFTLRTRNLATTPASGKNWFLTGGQLGGTGDHVTMGRSGINLGDFLVSASNPTPATALSGANFDVTQELHWFCWQDSAWHLVTSVTHRRELINPAAGPQFKVTVNGEPHEDDYTGHPAIVQATANPASIPPTTNAQAPSTATISATTFPSPLPAGHDLRFSLRPPALGCTINARTGVLTAGSQTGTVTVRVRDQARANRNFDETQVTVATPQAPPQPAPPQGGSGSAAPGTPPVPPATTSEVAPQPTEEEAPGP